VLGLFFACIKITAIGRLKKNISRKGAEAQRIRKIILVNFKKAGPNSFATAFETQHYYQLFFAPPRLCESQF